IFLESAYFNPSSIRRTEAAHGLKTDASSRFSKGTDPDMTVIALQKAAQLIIDLCGGEPSSDIIDIYPEKIQPFTIFLRYARLKMMSGMEIPKQKIGEILTLLNIKITVQKEDGMQLEVPPYKNDVLREIDIIEEILRLYGYNNIPLPAVIKMPYLVNPKPDPEKIRVETAHYLSANGFYEIFTNGISRSKYISKYLPAWENTQVKLLNSLNAELDCMRQKMLFSGLEVIAFNQNRRQTDLKLFEFGRTYFRGKNNYTEHDTLAIYMTGNKYEENWNIQNKKINFYHIKEVVEKLLKRMNVFADLTMVNDLFDGVEMMVDGKKIGGYGQVHENICADFDIKQPVYYAELDWKSLMFSYAQTKTEFKEIQRFPEVRRDLAVVIDLATQYEQLKLIALQEGKNILKDVILFDVYQGEKLAGKKSYAIGLIFRDDEKTLTDKEIDVIMQKMMDRYEKELAAVIRK
ncbi:MAG: phenylalanine--tRNA ligase subunit beta, partial [Chitinophagales bacterium]|nr:phenylalanine--tRNA ligase subunit beta [Chitinophagales bacterium]